MNRNEQQIERPPRAVVMLALLCLLLAGALMSRCAAPHQVDEKVRQTENQR